METTGRLKLIRLKLGYSAAEFAEKLGYTNKVSYQNIENGADRLSKGLLKKLQKSVYVNTDYLLTGKGEMFLKDKPFIEKEGKNIDQLIEMNLKLVDQVGGFMEMQKEMIKMQTINAESIRNLTSGEMTFCKNEEAQTKNVQGGAS